MGALATNRKRGGDECFNSNFNHKKKPPYSNSLGYQFFKKPRLSLINQSLEEENFPSNNTVSRISRYPEPEAPFPRAAVHAPVRHLKFGAPASQHKLDLTKCDLGNFFSSRFCNVKRQAWDTSSHFKKEKEVVFVEDNKKEEKGAVADDLIVEEVEGIEKGKYNVEEVEHFQPSSSSAVTELNNGNLRVESPLDMSSLREISNVQDLEAYKKLLEIAERRNSKLKLLDFQIELNEKRKAGLQALRPVKKPEEELVELVPSEPFIPLTEEETTLVSNALSAKNWRKILVSHQLSNIVIRGEVLQCLKPSAWLNDEVINLYLELLKEREMREPEKFLKCHFFNTFFYKKLVNPESGYNYKAVKRWTSQRKLGYCLLDCDKMFVPIHKDIHWCLAVINKKDQKFQYLDSLRGKDPYVLRALAKYFVEEVKDKSGKNIDISSWELEYVEDLPAQENGFDCGMFMLKYIDFYSRGLSLCFDQEHMPYFRTRTAKEILNLRAD
ncbi:Ubiquitin-like-specific protease ESD4 [Hibiscus syriacus]|uniref:Ubiquitin-like-specific protease ESD4 n=1 Tax=Hibiscus syriacus TaxID=106335 RepID=A0A6A3CDU5_HIBSY|nr:ubiquitin-like-specific protease ESD4 [Hibiscus syriacus]KAE8725881.1 Ubiquitin-like-specific protease ESD4 [Hibiscus syriacus]